jgi:hypothetical protein
VTICHCCSKLGGDWRRNSAEPARMQRHVGSQALHAGPCPPHAHQPGCQRLPHTAPAVLPLLGSYTHNDGRLSIVSAAASALDTSSTAAGRSAPAEGSQSDLRGDEPVAATDSWHPFQQPTLWEGSEADALQPGSPVLELAPPWRVRASAEPTLAAVGHPPRLTSTVPLRLEGR